MHSFIVDNTSMFMLSCVFGWVAGCCIYCYGFIALEGIRWIRKKLKERRKKTDERN